MLNNMFYHLFRLCLTCIDKNAIDLKGRVHKGAVKKGERYIICSGFIGQDLYMLNNMFYHLFRLCLTCIDKNAIFFIISRSPSGGLARRDTGKNPGGPDRRGRDIRAVRAASKLNKLTNLREA